MQKKRQPNFSSDELGALTSGAVTYLYSHYTRGVQKVLQLNMMHK